MRITSSALLTVLVVLHNVCIGPASGNGSKTTQHRTQQSVRFPDGANVIHAKILDDKAIVVLVKLDGESVMGVEVQGC